MDKLQRRDLEQILGIYPPWRIADLSLDPDREKLLIQLEEGAAKSRFRFLPTQNRKQPDPSQTLSNKVTYQWQHIRVGRFTTYIQADLNKNSFSTGIPPVFLGAPGKQYTHQLSQTVALAKAKNLDEDTISGLCGIDTVMVKSILMDIEASESERRADSLLPLESDPIWRAILTDEVNLTTRLLPLKLLLSRLKLNVYNKRDASVLQQSVAELRTFFVHHAQQLKSEYAQLGSVSPAESPKAPAASTGKLILPGTKNPIWHDILSGNFELHSRNMPLNLYVSKLKKQYEAESGLDAKVAMVGDLRTFFFKNARNLRPELTILTKIVKGVSEPGGMSTIPAVNDQIWRRLLSDDTVISSDKMNYRLLLARLRAIYHKQPDATQEEQVIEQLRSFFDQNKRTLSEEIKQLAAMSAAK